MGILELRVSCPLSEIPGYRNKGRIKFIYTGKKGFQKVWSILTEMQVG